MRGSFPVCRSPRLFAAYHVLPRFRKPRHPPFALTLFLSYSKTVNHYFKFLPVEIVALKTKILILIANHISAFFFTSFSLSILSKNFYQSSLPNGSPTPSFPLSGGRIRPGGRSAKLNFQQKRLRESTRPGPISELSRTLQTAVRASRLFRSAFSVESRSPKRRCSSHTFRYSYLVTT